MDFDQLDLPHRLEAFADGELPPNGRLEVMEYLAAHPEAMRQMLAAQRMRAACCRVIQSASGPRCSGEVKRRIAEMAQNEAPSPLSPKLPRTYSPAPDHGGWKLGFSRWLPVAAAAVFFVAALVALNLATQRSSLGDGSVLPVSQVELFQWRHTRCSRAIDELASGQYPQNIEALPGAIAQTLGHQPYPMLDLSGLGYVFDQAGPCTIPGSRSIHLIYKALPDTGRDDRLSLWIEPDEDKLTIEAGKTYRITGERAAHPMLIWKNAGMIYFLVGDSDSSVENAAATLSHAGG